MPESAPFALILCAFGPALESELKRRFQVVKLNDLGSAEARQWLRSHGAEVCAVVTNGKIGCSGALIDALPRLRIIAIHGVGFDTVDLERARARGIAVTNTPGVLTDDVADLAVGLVIALLRGIPRADRHIRDGDWSSAEFPLATRVSGKKFGIVGLGRIGSAIASRLSAFGEILYTGRSAKPVPWTFHDSVLSLAQASDVLIVASAANEDTRSLIDAKVLGALGEGGFLVNIARGSIVDEAALVEALKSGRLAGAALDVFADEPNVPADVRASDRVVLTPHVGSATVEARKAMAQSVLASLDAFLAGKEIPERVC